MNLTGFTITNHVYIPERLKPDSLFEKKYIHVRWQENRIYGDEEVLQLPRVNPEHPHYREWQVRLRSCKRLLRYLQKKNTPLKILEVGCGNGWLSHRLSALPGAEIVGADINYTELQQAARVFKEIPNLQFIYGDVQSEILEDSRFDVVIFAASIQYFPCITEITGTVLKLLQPGGEVHIMDSPFYKPGETDGAQKRTEAYYKHLGFPEMSHHYFHHCIGGLKTFQHQVLRKPSRLPAIFNRTRDPFTWVCIKKDPV